MGSVRRSEESDPWSSRRVGLIGPDVRAALGVASASERLMPFPALEEVHPPSAMGARKSAFGKDPFMARHELPVAHETEVPLNAMDMTIFIERA